MVKNEYVVVNISDSRQMYAELVDYYELRGMVGGHKFTIEYTGRFSNIEDIIENSTELYFECIIDELRYAADYLVSQGEYDMTVESFFEECFEPYSTWREHLQELIDSYAEICFEEEQMRTYREIRKQNRGTVIGGGFGIKGAAKGMATASMANMALGALHSVFNSIGNTIDEHEKKIKIEKLYSDPNISKRLSKVVYSDICSIAVVLTNVLIAKGLATPDAIIDDAEIQKAERIFINLKNKKIIGYDNIIKAISKIIELNPNHEFVFSYLIRNNIELVKEFMSVSDFLENKINKQIKTVIEWDFSVDKFKNKDEIIIKYEKMLKEFQDNGLDTDFLNSVKEQLNSKVESIDVRERTFEDNLYESESLFELAVKEKDELEQSMLNLSNNRKAIVEKIKELNNRKWIYKGVQKYLVKFEEYSRTVKNIVYPTQKDCLIASNINKLFEEISIEYRYLLSDYIFYFRDSFNDEKVTNFIAELKKQTGHLLLKDEILLYHDESFFKDGYKGLAITRTHFLCTVDKMGIIPLSEIHDVSFTGMINKAIKIIDNHGRKFQAVLTKSNNHSKAVYEILKYLVENLNMAEILNTLNSDIKVIEELNVNKDESKDNDDNSIRGMITSALTLTFKDDRGGGFKKNGFHLSKETYEGSIILHIEITENNIIGLGKKSISWINDEDSKTPGYGSILYDEIDESTFNQISGSLLHVKNGKYIDLTGYKSDQDFVKSFLENLRDKFVN
ncbi:MAG: hypothetical protein RBT49_03260 [Bacteroidales bacterium]|jgi:hypothetical protein|nr:hypothetical protein [Bacteroidales bacterium]